MAEATRVIEQDVRPLPQGKITYEQFLDWCDEDTFAEWVDGEVQMVSPVSIEHADLTGFLDGILRLFVEARDLGKILIAPFQMRLGEIRRGREPDILFVAKEHLNRLTRDYLEGPADMVVEIVSPESIARDRGDKFVEYEAAGVREYWLIDPQRAQAEFYILGNDQRYRLIPVGADGIFHSQVLDGFYLRVKWLWQEPLPKVADVLRELKLFG
jgi:Uma2 family endonuclease